MKFCKSEFFYIFSVDGQESNYRHDSYSARDAWKAFYHEIRFSKEKEKLQIK